jgi:hypothetical protein
MVEDIDGQLVEISDASHPLHGFIGEANVIDDNEVLVEIDERRVVTLNPSQVRLYKKADEQNQ